MFVFVFVSVFVFVVVVVFLPVVIQMDLFVPNSQDFRVDLLFKDEIGNVMDVDDFNTWLTLYERERRGGYLLHQGSLLLDEGLLWLRGRPVLGGHVAH